MNSTDHDPAAVNVSTPPPPFARLEHWMTLAEQSLSAIALFLIVSTMGAQVFARYFFGAPFSWSEEVARLALIWMTFLAASFVMAQGRHIAVDVLSHRLPAKGKAWLECFSHVAAAATCLLLMIGGSRFVWYVGKVGSPSLGIPMSVWYGAVEFGLLLMAIHSIINLLQVIATGQPTIREGLIEDEALQLELEPNE